MSIFVFFAFHPLSLSLFLFFPFSFFYFSLLLSYTLYFLFDLISLHIPLYPTILDITQLLLLSSRVVPFFYTFFFPLPRSTLIVLIIPSPIFPLVLLSHSLSPLVLPKPLVHPQEAVVWAHMPKWRCTDTTKNPISRLWQ
ncbi:hypothetical protein F4810DRAFT_259345 [Camillea tinctor]|nr:hypothetical protein F4810DRAFT_259345 [Camillea tinctor]